MAQNTNSVAFLKTKPVEDNTGQIIEEHIRYWRKFDSEEEADRKAEKARLDELNRKRNKESFDSYNGLAGIEAKGFYEDQIRNYIDINSDNLLDIATRASGGDRQAIVQYNQEKQKLQRMISAGVSVSAKIAKLQALKDSGQYNPVRDKDLNDFVTTINKSNYTVTPSGKFNVLDTTTDKWVDVDPFDLGRNFQTATFNKPVNFDELGAKLAKSISLTKTDGQQEITPENELEGIRTATDFLKTNANELATWAIIKDTKTPPSELTSAQLNQLGAQFYREKIEQNLQEIINPLGIQQKQASIASLRETVKKKQRGGEISLTLAKDPITKKARRKRNFEGYGDFEGDLLTVGGSGISITGVEGNKDTTTTIRTIGRDENGELIGFGTKVIKIPAVKETQGRNKGKTLEPAREDAVGVAITGGELDDYVVQLIGVENQADLAEVIDELTGFSVANILDVMPELPE